MSPVSRGRKKKGAGKSSRQARRKVSRPEPVRDGSFDRSADESELGWWADADMASRYLDGIDPTSDPDAVIARRRFAVPTVTARVHGADVELDPADEDERELLILAEHPEYRAVLDDPTSDELVDGVNPRLHLALHQIIANQLWEDDPPEVWSAAQRLLAEGHDRHAILHALAHELSEELHSALTGRRAAGPDVTAYRKRLRKL